MRSFAMLMKSGFRLAEIAEMDDAELLAWTVAFGEINGAKWDWISLQWQAESLR